MKSVKIVPINDLIEVHTAFNFFKANFFRTVQTELIAFLPLSEIYQTMLDNMQEDNKLQFLALAEELPVGCVICQKVDKTTLAMPVRPSSFSTRSAMPTALGLPAAVACVR